MTLGLTIGSKLLIYQTLSDFISGQKAFDPHVPRTAFLVPKDKIENFIFQSHPGHQTPDHPQVLF